MYFEGEWKRFKVPVFDLFKFFGFTDCGFACFLFSVFWWGGGGVWPLPMLFRLETLILYTYI